MSDYKNNWIAALRSGKYKQGQAALCVEDECGARRYCCLGVLAHLDGVLTQERTLIGGWKQLGWLEPVGTGAFVNDSMYEGVNEVLARITVKPPNEDVNLSLPYAVSGMNDDGWTFEQIADYLETVDF